MQGGIDGFFEFSIAPTFPFFALLFLHVDCAWVVPGLR